MERHVLLHLLILDIRCSASERQHIRLNGNYGIDLGCVHTSVVLVRLVRTKKENNTFGPGPLSIHKGIFDSEPKDTKPKGIVICSQPDWSG